jgi:hypothetical protein
VSEVIDEAYRAKNIEACVACKDSVIEAKIMMEMLNR